MKYSVKDYIRLYIQMIVHPYGVTLSIISYRDTQFTTYFGGIFGRAYALK